MTVEELTPLLDLFGLLPESKRVVGRPRLKGEHHRVLAQLRKRYRVELENAAAARIEALNLTRFVDRPRIVASLLEEGHNAPALLLTFNNNHLVILWAWRDALTSTANASTLKG